MVNRGRRDFRRQLYFSNGEGQKSMIFLKFKETPGHTPEAKIFQKTPE